MRRISPLAVMGALFLLTAPGLRAGADGLYDFFKKEKPAQKGEKKEEGGSKKGGAGEEKSLFDFFKQEEKKGEAAEKEHYVVHYYPYYWPYPYDPYFYRYEPRLRPATLPKAIGAAEVPTAIPPFYPTEAPPGSKMAVLRDIVVAWRDKNLDLIKAHLSPDVPISCYFKRRFSHVLSPEEFLRNTKKAFKILDTRSFRLEKIYRSHSDRFYVKGVHIFVDPAGVLRRVPIDYCFVKRDGRWIVRKVSYYGSAKGLKCVIASAAFGPDSPEVEALETFRDEVLWPTRAGRAVIRAYYRLSPPLARFVAGSCALRALVRLILRPVVWAARKLAEAPEPCDGPSLASL